MAKQAQDWRVDVLKSIGAPVTKQNLNFLTVWQRWEGGHTKNDARYNWLNTTKQAPGVVRSINSVGVKAFDSYQNGIRATAATLMNGRYDGLVAGFYSGNPYKRNGVSQGLQTWVSGKPDGNPAYAQKILGEKMSGGSAAPKATLPSGGRGPKGNPGLAAQPSGNKYLAALSREVFGSLAPDINQAFGWAGGDKMLPIPGQEPPMRFAKNTGKGIQLSTKFSGTHVTDGLGWGTKTAEDIMGNPGTAVKAPMGGKVVYFHPNGAQGGGSMLIRLKDGREMWLGHIDQGLKPGTRFRPGQQLAVISPDHPRPHVHVDIRG